MVSRLLNSSFNAKSLLRCSCWHFQGVFAVSQSHVFEFQSVSQTHWNADETAAAPYRPPHTPGFCLPGHTHQCVGGIFSQCKKDTPGGLTPDGEKVSVPGEMRFWWTGAHLCTNDKKMFAAVADLLFLPI